MSDDAILAIYDLAVAICFLMLVGSVTAAGWFGVWMQRGRGILSRNVLPDFVAGFGSAFTLACIVWVSVAGKDLMRAHLGITEVETPVAEASAGEAK